MGRRKGEREEGKEREWKIDGEPWRETESERKEEREGKGRGIWKEMGREGEIEGKRGEREAKGNSDGERERKKKDRDRGERERKEEKERGAVLFTLICLDSVVPQGAHAEWSSNGIIFTFLSERSQQVQHEHTD